MHPLSTAEIESALRGALPREHQEQAAVLARILTTAAAGEMTTPLPPSLGPLLRALAGAEIQTGQALLNFSGAQLGDVTIGDVAGGDLIKIYLVPPPTTLSPQERRDRTAMIKKVRAIWINGVLKAAHHAAVRVELGLDERRDLVNFQPFADVVEPVSAEPRPLAPHRPLLATFEELGGSLLILGAPGAGKTTLLLELARELLDRAEREAERQIPVILNLASWGQRQQPLVEWFAGELSRRYQAPLSLCKRWVVQGDILPLLDGLDEVDQGQRAACLAAINTYCATNGLGGIVVCSRLEDYDELRHRLTLGAAIVIRPLSPEQIDALLDDVGPAFNGMRVALHGDPALRELAQSPLMLNVMLLTYRDLDHTALPRFGTIAERRRQLFDAYIDRSVVRRSGVTHYTIRQIRHWLAWMAHTMHAQGLSVFTLDELRPTTMLPGRATLLYGLLLSLLLSALLTLPPLLIALATGQGRGIALGVVLLVPGIAVLGALTRDWRTTWLTRAEQLAGGERLSWDWLRALVSVFLGPLVLVIAGIGVGLSLVSKLLPLIILFALIRRLTTALRSTRPVPKTADDAGTGLLATLPVSTWAGIRARVSVWTLVGPVVGGLLGVALDPRGPGAAAAGFAIGAAVAGAIGGLGPSTAIRQQSRANDGVVRAALTAGLVAGAISFASIGVVAQAPGAPRGLVAIGCTYFALVGALACGGLTVLQHVAVRVILGTCGNLPWRPMRFLDDANDLLLLRRVGDGYSFIHRLLLEHCLAAIPESIAAVTPLPSGSRMPLAPSPYFTGREAELRQIASILLGMQDATLGQVVTLAGPPGIGKTQLAVELVHRYGAAFPGGVFWLNAADPTALRIEIADCGNQDYLNLHPAYARLGVAELRSQVQAAWERADMRLLVFDGCEDVATLERWAPVRGGCRVLATARDPLESTTLDLVTLTLGPLPRSASLVLLGAGEAPGAAADGTWRALAEQLGDIPLALTLARSEPAQGGRAERARYSQELRSSAPHDVIQEPSKPGHASAHTSIERVFAVSCARLQRQGARGRLALALLARAACFAPGTHLPRQALLGTLQADRSMEQAPQPAEIAALEHLLRLNLLQTGWHDTFLLHSALAALIRDTLCDKAALAASEEIVIAACAPPPPDLRRLAMRLVALRHFVTTAVPRSDERMAQLLTLLSGNLRLADEVSAADAYHMRALDCWSSVYAANPCQGLLVGSELALLMQNLGDARGAQSLMTRLLDLAQQVPSTGHANEICALRLLAVLVDAHGDSATSLRLLHQAEAAAHSSHDIAYPRAMSVLAQLAKIQIRAGMVEEAQRTYRCMVARQEARLGVHHPSVAASKLELARALCLAGAHEAAVVQGEQALQIYRKTQERDALPVGWAYSWLGWIYAQQGYHATPLNYYHRAARIYEQHLGAKHPDTLQLYRRIREVELAARHAAKVNSQRRKR